MSELIIIMLISFLFYLAVSQLTNLISRCRQKILVKQATGRGKTVLVPLFGYIYKSLLRKHLFSQQREKKRLMSIRQSFPELLSFIINGLKASLSLNQTLMEAALTIPGYLGDELKQMTYELEAGIDIETVLDNAAARNPLPEMQHFRIVITTQHWIGGNLSIALETLNEVVRNRLAIYNDVRVLTAQSRFSCLVLGSLPLGFMILIPTFSGHSLWLLMKIPAFWMIAGIGLLLNAAGFLILRRLVVFEVD